METELAESAETAGFSLDKLPFYGRVLLLQGPVGPFFARLAGHLRQRGSSVTKVNFNYGDDWFYPRGDIIRFSGTPDQWPRFLQALIAEGNYDAVFLFGDCRPIHRPVGDIARASGCAVWVFEEGYFRPDYITLERDGVNAFSSLARLKPEELREEPILPIRIGAKFPDSFQRMAWQAFTYFAMIWFGAWRYPHYLHHKPSGWIEGFRWVRWGIRRKLYSVAQAATISQVLCEQRKNRFFVFPLQVHNDAQLHAHSDSHGIHVCLTHVMKSFAQNASQDDWLVIKHHPLDRGHTNYRKIIGILTEEMGLAGRVHYVHDVHLPTLFDHCKGLVTVNSTAGLQGLHHKLPIVTLGRSFYSKPGLTYQGGLDSFWTTDWKPDYDLYLRFRACTIARTQINSSFYADATCGSKRGFSRAAAPAGELAPRGFEASLPPSVSQDDPSIGTAVSL
jgi:capsular polysaccharide export protein